MATHETASVTVFPTSLQNHGMNVLKEGPPMALPPPANSVQHMACASSPQTSPAVNILEKTYHPHNLSHPKPAGILEIVQICLNILRNCTMYSSINFNCLT